MRNAEAIKLVAILKGWSLDRNRLRGLGRYADADELRQWLVEANVDIKDNKDGTSKYTFINGDHREKWEVKK